MAVMEGARDTAIRGADVSSRFRTDIQGMRAIAVLVVLAYHVWPASLPGGYIGVDVFFVISGYLITGLLVREFERSGTISLRDFYARRIRRLLPAATATLLAVGVAAFAWMSSADWRDLSRELVASALYVENLLLVQRSVDYLALDAAPSPVQHFWSLSVEEQFYIGWPLLMLGVGGSARRRGWSIRRSFLVALLLVTVGSLAYGIYVSFVDPAPGYFLTTTRVWELGIGGLLAISAAGSEGPAWLRRVLGWSGVAAIMAAAWFYSSRLPFPGYEALLPTLGAAAVLYARAGAGDWLGRALGARVMQYVGDISYSLYLWHWPVVVFYPSVTGRAVETLQDGVLVVAVSLVLAHVSKYQIEERFRHGAAGERWRPYAIAGVLTALVVACAVALTTMAPSSDSLGASGESGSRPGALAAPGDTTAWAMPDPASARHDLAEAYARNCITPSRGEDVRICRYGSESGMSVVAVGDSHLVQWLPALEVIAIERGWNLVAYTKTGCAFMAIDEDEVDTVERRSCAVWNARVQVALSEARPQLIIVAASLGAQNMLEGYARPVPAVGERMAVAWAAASSATEARIIGIQETPQLGFDPLQCLTLRAGDEHACSRPLPAGYDAVSMVALASSSTRGSALIDMSDVVCPSRRCDLVRGGVYVWRDSHHLTATFVRSAAPLLSARISELLEHGGDEAARKQP